MKAHTHPAHAAAASNAAGGGGFVSLGESAGVFATGGGGGGDGGGGGNGGGGGSRGGAVAQPRRVAAYYEGGDGGSGDDDSSGHGRRRSTASVRDNILNKSLLGAESSQTSSAAVTDVNLFSAVLDPITLFFKSKALEDKYRLWAFKAFSGSYGAVYFYLGVMSVVFALGNVYVQLLLNGDVGDLESEPPPFFIYSPPSKPVAELPSCELDNRLQDFNAAYNFTNNTFAICGLTIGGNYSFASNVFFWMHLVFAVVWTLQWLFLRLANKRMEDKIMYQPAVWYGISIVAWTGIISVKLVLFSYQKLPFSMMGFPIGYEIMLMMASLVVLHGLPFFHFALVLTALCIGMFVWFWYMLGQVVSTYIFIVACVAMTLAMGIRYARSMERWNRHSFIMFERLVAAEIKTDLDDNPFKLGNLIDWARSNSTRSSRGLRGMLGKWAIEYEDIDFQDRVASGGSGVIWWGRYRDQKVAIKEIYSVMTSSGLQVDELKEFGNEVRVLRALVAAKDYHPGLLQFFGVSKTAGATSPRLFMVMEWCPVPLDAVLQEVDKVPRAGLPEPADRNWVVLYSAIVTAAVEWLHRKGVVHRDLKPSNILLQEVGEHDRVGAYINDTDFERVFGCRYMKVKLADFGLALLDSDDDSDGSIDFAGVEPETGTPGFMAPELFHANGAGPIDTLGKWKHVDEFALGVTLAAMTVSAPDPFTATSSRSTGKKHTEAELMNVNAAELLEGLPANSPKQLVRAIGQAIQRDPPQRPGVPVLRGMLLNYFWDEDIGDGGDPDTLKFVLKVAQLHSCMCAYSSKAAAAAIAKRTRMYGKPRHSTASTAAATHGSDSSRSLATAADAGFEMVGVLSRTSSTRTAEV